MGPRRPDKESKKQKRAVSRDADSDGAAEPISPKTLIKAAESQLQEGNLEEAEILVERALGLVVALSDEELAISNDELLVMDLYGQINLETGDHEMARRCFERAIALDEDGTKDEAVGGGPDKFLCFAQLSEMGGMDSIKWFEKGASALKKQIQTLEEVKKRSDQQQMLLEERKKKLAMTLCSVVEVYMTDLSLEQDAEQRCEALVTEATMVAPDFAETWQTLANVRISQNRFDDAKAALTRSLELWTDLSPEDPAVPDFASRVSLARLLIEVAMGQEAIDVLERLVSEDDQSVEVWYLGGWGLYVMGENQKESKSSDEDWKASWISSRVWLNQCQHLYQLQNYRDERLGEHAKELLGLVAEELGEAPSGEGDEDQWDDDDDDDDDDDSDEEMKD